MLQTLRSYEGFRASAPRHSVHICRQATQVSLAVDPLLGLGLFGKLLQCHDGSTLLLIHRTCMQTIRRQMPLRVECARVGGVEIPNQKRIEFSLQYIYGVGHTTAKAILVETVQLSMHHPRLAVHGLSFVLTHAGCKSMPCILQPVVSAPDCATITFTVAAVGRRKQKDKRT